MFVYWFPTINRYRKTITIQTTRRDDEDQDIRKKKDTGKEDEINEDKKDNSDDVCQKINFTAIQSLCISMGFIS